MSTTSTARHIAIIMDGNGRWAKSRNKPRNFGHREGAKSVRRIVEHAARLGVEALTLYAFSSENWRRPPKEVKLLFELLVFSLNEQIDELHANNIRFHVIGQWRTLPKRLVSKIEKALERTSNNTGMVLNIALNYGGRSEITLAAKQLAEDCVRGKVLSEQIDETMIEEKLSTVGLPPLDLLIRTGGEIRLSNFLLWQAAYAELFFTEVYWPDFNKADLDRAISWFTTRKRRFGQTDDQINQAC